MSSQLPTRTLSSLLHLSRDELYVRLTRTEPPSLPSDTAIIDVRDDDHIGGHIKGSRNVPSNTLDYKMPQLVRELREKSAVIFHCALSQSRGPAAALAYLRERDRLIGVPGKKTQQDGEEGKVEEKEQEVYLLDGGFTKWQRKFGTDAKVTEAYRKDIWQS